MTKVKHKREIIYWICQIIGWTIFTLFMISIISFQNRGKGVDSVSINIVLGSCFLFTSHLLRLLFKRYNYSKLRIFRLFIYLLITNITGAFICQMLINLLLYFVVKPQGLQPATVQSTIYYMLNINMIFWLWSVIYFVIHYFENYKSSEIEKIEVKLALKDAELEMLKKQIDPHFTFNALNNIRMLILEDQRKAREAVTSLSDLLRYSLQKGKGNYTVLGEEVELTENYLSLQKIQYEDKLRYKIDIDKDLYRIKVPPFMLQLLVENAVKHGIAKQVKGGDITISVNTTGNSVSINIYNTGVIIDSSEGTKTGLKNLRCRIETLFSGGKGPELIQYNKDTVLAKVTIPLKYESSNS
ncbi:MAG: histidine kinase [Bacteroidales bacterium]|nr:histidine kinase [Bacteroidales bacterium]